MKVDLKKQIPSYTARRGTFSIVEVPSLQYLMVDGQGDPNTSQAYADAVGSLYPLAYTLKFLSKRELDRDYVVPPLEALWWAEDMAAFTTARDKSRWSWTVMIAVPDWLGAEQVEAAREAVRSKGGAPALEHVRFEALDEGLSVQTLHIGPYDDEAPVLAAMHTEFIPSQGLRMTGRHHEIYLSDPRRMPAERLRTILRQPVERDSA
ncbi:GyrI-like domain-containing protein [Ruania rhizosphaerae]|uniref:GyrI-like domain-containing protein n=1 Tax=Ruania rhizosphaerae TaxID=1840413 RepID=UPI00135B95C6|nr:GyrI-like domain-containing protein [Ruania rhizosphaerae]